jgi:hypothetical protein
VKNPSTRRLVISMAIMLAVLVLLAGVSTRPTITGPPLPPPQTAAAPASVVTGRLPADGTVRAREGQVVSIGVRSTTDDIAEIAQPAVSVPVGPELNLPLEFAADDPGRFNVTLRYSGKRVGQVVVSPSSR